MAPVSSGSRGEDPGCESGGFYNEQTEAGVGQSGVSSGQWRKSRSVPSPVLGTEAK